MQHMIANKRLTPMTSKVMCSRETFPSQRYQYVNDHHRSSLAFGLLPEQLARVNRGRNDDLVLDRMRTSVRVLRDDGLRLGWHRIHR